MDNLELGRSAGVQLTVRPAAKEERAYKPEKKLRVAQVSSLPGSLSNTAQGCAGELPGRTGGRRVVF